MKWERKLVVGNKRLVLSRSVGHDADTQLSGRCGAKGKVTKITVAEEEPEESQNQIQSWAAELLKGFQKRQIHA